ncbi:MAG: LemA family protein [Planctomycetaceae bacterium]|nr:LemA family protein [Planctomycetaceae bacterium]
MVTFFGLTFFGLFLLILGGISVILFLLVLWVISIYNGLVSHRNRYKNAFAQIDVQLKRRYELIPNLVETAKGYMKHERETLEAVIQARNIASGAAGKAAANPTDGQCIKQLNQAEGELTGALSRLMLVFEQYPDLKASQNMLSLQEELTSTENKIAFARQAFNDSVMTYNNAREVFPSNFISGMFNFSEAALFEVDSPQERTAPKVAF